MTLSYLRPEVQFRVLGSWTAICVSVVGAAAVAGSLAGITEDSLLPSLLLPVALAVALRPEFGAYLYLLVTPLVVGIPRGAVAPIIRPSEGLLILIVAAWSTRIFVDGLRGRGPRLAFDRVELALVLLAFTASVPPLLLRFGRELPISDDDILYALVLWKYLLVYCLFRYAVTTAAQVRLCLWLAMLSSAMVALVATMQVFGLFGVPELLWTYYDRPFEGISGLVTHRGTSTVASSFSMADMMVMSLAIALAWLPAAHGPRRVILSMAAVVFVFGCIASAQFSAVIGLGVAVLTIRFVTGRTFKFLLALIPAGLAASVFFWSLIEIRLSGFSSPGGLPPSWAGRLDNLERFFWPELSSGFNWLIGVRPAARVAAPEQWREWVYIESGYTWLLWTGGVPMLAAFAWFVWTGFRSLASARRGGEEPMRVAATAAIVSLAVIVVLMLFDPHLTMRGSADLFFPLLALSFVKDPRKAA